MGFLESLRPMFPWEGPPLPFFLGLFWPWVETTASPSSTSLANLFSGAPQGSPPPAYENQGNILYENEERIKLVRGEDGHITELVINRKVTQDV